MRNKRRVYVVMATAAAALFAAGVVAAVLSRNDSICADHKPPVAQRDTGLGQVEYRCHDGTIVTK